MESKSISRWLSIVVVLQALALMTLWCGGPAAQTAKADGIPDAGAQRQEMIDQLKATNEKLDSLLGVLTKGELQVRVSKIDQNKGRD